MINYTVADFWTIIAASIAIVALIVLVAIISLVNTIIGAVSIGKNKMLKTEIAARRFCGQ